MRVLLLTQYYAPEPVDKFTDLARGLAARGHQVEVITGFPCYPQGKVYGGWRQSLSRVDLVDGVRVIRVPQWADHSRSVVRRAMYYLSFALSAATMGLWRSRRADVLLVYQSALPTGVAAWVISRWKRIPYVLDVADLWPESVAASGMLTNRLALRLLRGAARFVYCGAAAINVITEGYRDSIAALGIDAAKIRLIHYWPSAKHTAALLESASLRGPESSGTLTVLYAGVIGPCQQLRTVIQAARLLRDRPEIQFQVAGEGIERAALEREVAEGGDTNVRFLGWQTAEQVAALSAAADALLVHLKPDAMSRVSIPSKTFTYMASGRPIIMAVEGEAARLVESHGCGVAAPPSQPGALADTVRRLAEMSREDRQRMGQEARRAFEESYSAEVQIGKVDASLRAVLSRRAAA